MKKRLTVLVLAFAMIFTMAALTACGGGGSSDSGDAAAEESFTFKHGYDKDFPPYSYIGDDGQTTGFDVELAQAVCELNGWGYEGVPINWDAKEAELESGSIDCIWSGFTKSPDREPKFAWSDPYSVNTIKIMVLEGSDIKSTADLAGKKVGVQGSTSAQEMLETPNAEGGAEDLMNTFAAFEKYDTYTVAVNDLKAGAIDAIAIDVTTGDYQMTKVEGLAYLDEDVCQEVYAIGFRTDDTDLRDQVNAALKTLAENGKMDEIGQKYPEIYENLSMINN
ncbi:MAG: transporter substrate-binding domain-containing protein [Mogibacterium sp.]|nr:transporter substrate-binding domain-containing protein [Mogibacterium sp.]MBR2390770.1 transporter substrate-binding domain-containing protein [Mogibacterium sp.]MBR3330261.1 transporter substrate-binding domain-containing protein [Mogibacterium sp.]MBR3331960.1 transporter substrate-binding domain-containing protein [Mogibacterium sp.]MBR4089761.1 transporter substrate-binding domain-containing protein [Mogibacterium sp.]